MQLLTIAKRNVVKSSNQITLSPSNLLYGGGIKLMNIEMIN